MKKREAIMDGARKVFTREGYDGASMDAVAKEARVAKPTLYKYFRDKNALYVAVVESSLTARREEIAGDELTDLPPSEGIRVIARQMTLLFGRDNEMLSLARMTFSGFNRFPLASATFHENGPRRGRKQIEKLLEHWKAQGELAIEDPQCASEQLVELCKACLFDKRMFGDDQKVSIETCERIAEEAALTFLARYGVATTDGKSG